MPADANQAKVDIRSAVDFYEKHPISAAIILAKVKAARGNLDDVRPEELFAHDQDHYGGLAANDAMAAAADLKPGMAVADFCAGLGGPARYYAVKHGVTVTGIELTPPRVAGAAELTRLVGLDHRVGVLEGNVMRVPLADATQDAVLSQEAFLHVPDLPRTFAEAHRILKPGGRFVFSTWTAPAPLSPADRRLMWDGMAVADLFSLEGLQDMVRAAGFEILAADSLSRWWAEILSERLAMYRKLRTEAERAETPAGHDAFYESYVRFVELMNDGGLGGVRLSARRT